MLRVIFRKWPYFRENEQEAALFTRDIRQRLSDKLATDFALRTDLVKSLMGRSKWVFLNALFVAHVKIPSFCKTLCSMALSPLETLELRAGVLPKIVAAASSLVEAGLPTYLATAFASRASPCSNASRDRLDPEGQGRRLLCNCTRNWRVLKWRNWHGF